MATARMRENRTGSDSRLKRRIFDVGALLAEFWDLVIAGGVALFIVGATALGWFDGEHPEHLVEGTAIVLAALSATLVRERVRRDRLAADVKSALDLVSASSPWEALSLRASWSLAGDDATAVTEREIRVLQNDLLTIHDFSRADGVEEDVRYACGPSGAETEMQILQKDVPGRRGRRYRVVSLGRVVERGARMRITCTRHLRGAFSKSSESVTTTIEMPTDRLELVVTFEAARPPSQVRLEADHGSAPQTFMPTDLLTLPDGGLEFRRSIERPSIDDVYAVSWDW